MRPASEHPRLPGGTRVHARAPRRSVGVIAAAFVLAAFGSGARAALDERAEGLTPRIEAILAASTDAVPNTAQARAKELAGLGGQALPGLFAALSARFEAHDAPPAPEALRERERAREMLTLALELFPPERVRAELVRELRPPTSFGERRAAVHLLARRGRAQDVGLLLALAPPAGSDEQRAREEQRVLELALGEVLQRDLGGYAVLEDAFAACETPLKECVVRAVGRVGAPQGLALLARVIERDRPLAITALCAIEALDESRLLPVDEQLAAAVRRLIADKDPQLLPKAVLLAGRLHDAESIPHMISLLDDENRGVRTNAHWSLQHITGLKLRPASSRWIVWYRDEERWWRGDSARAFQRLQSPDPLEVRSALAEIARQHSRRHELASAVTRALDSPDASIVSMACYVLGALRSQNACQALLGCLTHADPRVRDSAWQALVKITGRRLPLDAETWRRALRAS